MTIIFMCRGNRSHRAQYQARKNRRAADKKMPLKRGVVMPAVIIFI